MDRDPQSLEGIDNSSPKNRDPVVIAITGLIISVATPDHSACTRDQSLWFGNDIAIPERRRGIGFRDFMIVTQCLAYQPRRLAIRFV